MGKKIDFKIIQSGQESDDREVHEIHLIPLSEPDEKHSHTLDCFCDPKVNPVDDYEKLEESFPNDNYVRHVVVEHRRTDH